MAVLFYYAMSIIFIICGAILQMLEYGDVLDLIVGALLTLCGVIIVIVTLVVTVCYRAM